jgi:hypothetical protein
MRGPTARGDRGGRRPVATQQPIAACLVAVVQLEDVHSALAPGGGGRGAEEKLNAFLAQNLGECLAERPGLVNEQVPSTLDQHDFAAQAMDRLRQLDADRPFAEHEQSTRHGLHTGHFTVRPNSFERGVGVAPYFRHHS